jgi:hypothetical protein
MLLGILTVALALYVFPMGVIYSLIVLLIGFVGIQVGTHSLVDRMWD